MRSTLVASLVAVFAPLAGAAPITTASLVEEMIDMRRLAEFPQPAYRNVQFSSYDRTSSVPGGPGWFANSDGFGKEPTPNFEQVLKEPSGDAPGEYLICDVPGPGAIVRTWTAAIRGKLRVTLDDTTVYDGSAQDFLLHPYASFSGKAGLDRKLFENSFDQRNASYSPMPFAKRCRIVWVGRVSEIHFYEVQLRLYEADAQVETFSADALKSAAPAIERVAKVLRDPQGSWTYASKLDPKPIRLVLPPGEKAAVELEGPGAIERLTVRLAASDLKRALRSTLLHVHCDDYPWGQVEAPVGDFFGAAPGVNPFNSVPMTVASDGTMTCRYVMPFAKNARVTFENRGDQPVEISGEVLPAPYTWNDERSMYFRARWRVDHELTGSPEAIFDLPFLTARGQGVYVGTAAMLLNPNPVPTPGGNWWGEGDEKIFVDDEARPSIFGTGSEDYFNYAWSSPEIWGFSYAGQPRNDGPANRGFVTNHRWHILDPIPFRKAIAFYMELFPHERTPGMSYARIGYYYARPGAMDDHIPITDDDVRLRELPPNWEPAARHGATNAVFYEIQKVVQGNPPHEIVRDNLYSHSDLFVWKPQAAGEELTLKFPITEAKEYRVHLVARLSPDSGRLSAALDGQPVKFERYDDGLDLKVPDRTILRQIHGRTVKLEPGDHTLTLRYEGGGEIGLDFLWVQR